MLSDHFLFEFIGVLGFGLYVLNYMLLTLRVLDGHGILYFVLNAAAASMVLVGLMASFNLASVLIQVFWIVISIVAISMRLIGPPKRSVTFTRAAA